MLRVFDNCISLFRIRQIHHLYTHKDLFDMNFKYGILGIKSYIINRIFNNDIATINNLPNENISPPCYALLRNCPPTPIPVERSFSMLKKILAVW